MICLLTSLIFHLRNLENYGFLWSVIRRRQRRQWHPTPVLLPGKSHGWRSLVGCNTWGRQESDMTERLYFHFSLSCIGDGNGNPLQYSCLENPRDWGAWWAAIYGITQSRVKWLSSSSANSYPLTWCYLTISSSATPLLYNKIYLKKFIL